MKRTVAIIASLAFGLGMALVVVPASVKAKPAADTMLPPVTNTDGRAGASFTFYPGPQGEPRYYLPLAVQTGARWDRFDFGWPRLEPVDNAWDFGAYDTLVNELHAYGIPNVVGILQMTPSWAATQCAPPPNSTPFQLFGAGTMPAPPSPLAVLGETMPHPQAPQDSWGDAWVRAPPSGLYNSWTSGNFNGNQWAEFVYTTVSHFEDRVKSWEMWNEAEWDVFWCGSEQDYAQLLKVGYQATKAACPDCTVLFAGLYFWVDQTFFERVLDIINDDPDAPTNNYFFDALSVHLYGRTSHTYDAVNYIHNRMALHVPAHPIWLTETGVPVWGDPQAYNDKYDYSATQDEVAAYVIQSYANALASGVGRYFWFRTHDADMGEYFGLIRNDGSVRPAYSAYQVATTYLISPTFTTRVATGSNVRATLWGTPRGKVSVLWNNAPDTSVYTLPATIPTATVVNRWGVTQTVAAPLGYYTFTLPGATANLLSNPDDYIIGGDPLIVIESEMVNQPPTATVHALPDATYTPSFTVTWEGLDNEAGIWLYDVQVRDGENGTWALWKHSTTTTSGVFDGASGHRYDFRARATDRVGNRGDWPQVPQAWTTVSLTSTLHLTVGPFFADENRNGVWDTPTSGADEVQLTDVTLRFVDNAGNDVVTPAAGDTWEFTTTITAGEMYRLQAATTHATADYLRRLSFTWPQSGEVYTETLGELGLWPVKHVYLPLVMRQ